MKTIFIDNYDYEFYAEVYQKGATIQSIDQLMKNNIRKDILPELTDSDFNELGIKNIGDKFILKKMI